jgi:hypothetical protein
MSDKPFAWLHSDAVVPGCDCGERAWQVDLPVGWMYAPVTSVDPAGFATQADALTYAASLHPEHPDVRRSLARVASPAPHDLWAAS